MRRRDGFGLALLGAAALACVAGLVVGARLLEPPDWASPSTPDPAAGARVQQRLAEVFLRGAGVSNRTEPVIIDAAELNTFLERHVESRRLALRPLQVRAEFGRVGVAGRTSLGRALSESHDRWFVSWLPSALLQLELWLSAEGRLVVREGEGEFVAEQAAIGRQRVPTRLLWELLGIEPREALVWRMPRIVERVEVERGRLLIHTRAARPASRSAGQDPV